MTIVCSLVNLFSLSLSLSLYSLYHTSAPSAAPVNLTGAFNDSDSIRISWSAPPLNDQNGEIISYLIIYERTDGKSDALFMEETNDTSFLITFGLMPFTNYSVQVAARTTDLGPDTDPVVIATDSACEFWYSFVCSCILNWHLYRCTYIKMCRSH